MMKIGMMGMNSSSSSSSSGSSSEDEADETKEKEKVNFSVDAMSKSVPRQTKSIESIGETPRTVAAKPVVSAEKVQMTNFSSWSTLKDGNVSSTPSTPLPAAVESDDFSRMKSQALEAQEKVRVCIDARK